MWVATSTPQEKESQPSPIGVNAKNYYIQHDEWHVHSNSVVNFSTSYNYSWHMFIITLCHSENSSRHYISLVSTRWNNHKPRRGRVFLCRMGERHTRGRRFPYGHFDFHDLCISSSIMKLKPTFYARPHYKDMLMPFKIRAGLASL